MIKILAFCLLMLPQQHRLTLTCIDHVSGTDSLKVLVKLNYGNLLQDYRQTINDDIDISEFVRTGNFPSDMANAYINSKVAIYVNEKLLTGKLIKMERSDENITLNILYLAKKKFRTLKVRNALLTGLHSNVENLTIIRIGNFEEGVKFTQQNTEKTFFLKEVKQMQRL